MARHTPPLNARDTTLSDLEPLELVHGHMPKWLLGADPQIITALDASMAHSRFYHGWSARNSASCKVSRLIAGRCWR